MAKWREVKMGDVCLIERGGSPRPIDKYITKEKNGINWIKIGDTNESMYITSTAQKIIPEGMKKSRYVQPGDFLLSNSMSFGRPYILAIDGCIHDGWLVLRDINNVFDKHFLYYYLSAPITYQKFKSLAVGGVVNNLNSEMVRNIKVALPPMEEQQKIAAVLDKVSDLIAKRRQQLEKLDLLVKARFVEMFGDRLKNDKNWNQKPLQECVMFYNGKAHEQVIDENGQYILVTSKYIASNQQEYRKTNDLLFPLCSGDICMVMSDVPNGRALAKCILIDQNNKYTLNQRICCFRDYEFNSLFLLYTLNRHEYFLSFNDGDSQTNLRKNDILSCQIILPPMELQNKFADFVEQTEKTKTRIRESLTKLEILKKALMQEYFE